MSYQFVTAYPVDTDRLPYKLDSIWYDPNSGDVALVRVDSTDLTRLALGDVV